MPHPLSLELIDYNAQDAKTKHRSIVFSGLYCIGSPESEFWRVRFGKHKLGVKIGKSYDILRRLNEYLLYFPFSNPGMRVHCLLCMPHAQTKAQKSNVDRAETFVLRELKKKYPSAQNWPGIQERFRVYMSRSEWICGVPLVEVEKLFKVVSSLEKEFGPSLYILNGPDVNIPDLWYKFRHGVITEAKETAAAKKAQEELSAKGQERLERKRKWDDIYEPRKYKPRAR